MYPALMGDAALFGVQSYECIIMGVLLRQRLAEGSFHRISSVYIISCSPIYSVYVSQLTFPFPSHEFVNFVAEAQSRSSLPS
jgi:hypothetical protein